MSPFLQLCSFVYNFADLLGRWRHLHVVTTVTGEQKTQSKMAPSNSPNFANVVCLNVLHTGAREQECCFGCASIPNPNPVRAVNQAILLGGFQTCCWCMRRQEQVYQVQENAQVEETKSLSSNQTLDAPTFWRQHQLQKCQMHLCTTPS